jgi:hypothetical protein
MLLLPPPGEANHVRIAKGQVAGKLQQFVEARPGQTKNV